MENMNCMFRLATAPTILLGGDQKKMIQFDLEKQKEIRVVGSYLLLFHLAEAKLGRKIAGNPLGGENWDSPRCIPGDPRVTAPDFSQKLGILGNL